MVDNFLIFVEIGHMGRDGYHSHGLFELLALDFMPESTQSAFDFLERKPQKRHF